MTDSATRSTLDLAHASAVAAHELAHDVDAAQVLAQTVEAALHRGDSDQALTGLAGVQRALERLAEDIERLLADRGGALTRLERKPTNLATLVRRVVDAHPTGQHHIEVQVTEVVIRLDRIKVERILDNLLTNALTHTPPGSRIRVSATVVPGSAELVVEDEGPGLPDDVRDVLLGSARAPTDPPPEVGMGLWIVVQFARLHGGDVTVRPTRGSRGARFTVRLPARER